MKSKYEIYEPTKEQALALLESGWWKNKNEREIAIYQMFTARLCLPFSVFHQAVEHTLDRPVWTHEFGLNADGLRAELLGETGSPSMQQIIDMIPEEKRIIAIV